MNPCLILLVFHIHYLQVCQSVEGSRVGPWKTWFPDYLMFCRFGETSINFQPQVEGEEAASGETIKWWWWWSRWPLLYSLEIAEHSRQSWLSPSSSVGLDLTNAKSISLSPDIWCWGLVLWKESYIQSMGTQGIESMPVGSCPWL